MAENHISKVELASSNDEIRQDGDVSINVKFSLLGQLRDAFNEKNWTDAYNKYDNSFKMKYGIKLQSGGFKKRTIGKEIDTYRKASIFWTRNPKLVNAMKDKRVWVQVAKNFRPIIRLTEEEVRQELFDFDERITFRASELGAGTHTIAAEVHASWQKHDYTDSGSAKNRAEGIEVTIN